MEMYGKGTKWIFMKLDGGMRLEVLEKRVSLFALVVVYRLSFVK